MTFLLPAHTHLRQGQWTGPAAASVSLTYDERLMRRRRLETTAGGLMVDLGETVSLNPGDALRTEDARIVEIEAADEPLVRVSGDLARLAWHIGNRHTPCQIDADTLTIRQDHVLEAMLLQLGASLTRVMAPFRPEGGAYGMGRTFGHDHGPNGFPHAHP
ncbi:urease accessory protein UreE [Phaeovulum sp.]|uniref:urease accessory protein UreE n=1 Tax=Phaeovulum sp. TaxID=2934796 RepID=UPI003566EFA1